MQEVSTLSSWFHKDCSAVGFGEYKSTKEEKEFFRILCYIPKECSFEPQESKL